MSQHTLQMKRQFSDVHEECDDQENDFRSKQIRLNALDDEADGKVGETEEVKKLQQKEFLLGEEEVKRQEGEEVKRQEGEEVKRQEGEEVRNGEGEEVRNGEGEEVRNGEGDDVAVVSEGENSQPKKNDLLTPAKIDDQAPEDVLWRTLLGEEWFDELKTELKRPYFLSCLAAVEKERRIKQVYPPPDLVFNAFRRTPLGNVKVVIVGQDPYHAPGQAMGLCFSVNRHVKIPPSLVNIFKEIGFTSHHGDLSFWADQGVCLLNSLLTVVQGMPMAHKSLGWANFTDRVIGIINAKCEGVVFMLWGKPAQLKGKSVDRQRHLVLEAGHPSPLSVRFFTGCDHFRKCNEYLESSGASPIQWQLPQ